jgi:Spy/CpxP family protein refolding chaperone
MTNLRQHLITGLTALSLGAAAFAVQAQTAPQAPSQQGAHAGHHQQLTPEQRAAFRAQRVAKLHDALKITPAQESAFNSFVTSMQPPAHAKQDRAAWASLTAPQRMAKAIDMQKQRTAAMQQRLTALDTFYAVLTPDQKKTFDERSAHMHGRFGHGGHGGWQQRGGTAQG